MKGWSALLAALLVTHATAQNAPMSGPSREANVAFRELLCGKQGMPPTSTEIPTIGCFGVPSGGTARGMFEGHEFTVAVDPVNGPKCRYNGTAVPCTGCIGEQIPACPVKLTIASHNTDGSMSFSVQRKADGDTYLFRIDAWNSYLERKQPREDAATAQSAPGGLPLGAPLAPAPPAQSLQSPLPPGMVPGVAEATDGPSALDAVGWTAQSAYRSGQFAKLDALVEAMSQPDQLTDDGLPRLQGVYNSIWASVYAWKDWEGELHRIATWRKTYPDSYAADLVEAIVWRAWAWHTRGEGSAATVTSEGWKLFEAKLSRADEVLEKCKHRASRSPLWYQLRLGIARDAGWSHERYRTVFDEATQQFPWYVPLYLWAANYLSPKWGGTYQDVDALARRTATIPLGADYSLYARVYWHLTEGEPLEFEPFQDSAANWPLMKAGFEGLMKRYPKSKWNLNAYAYFACRANDGSTYGALRARIGRDVIATAWTSNYSMEVCDERLLGQT